MTGTADLRPVEVVRRASGYLDRHGVESPDATAERLLLSVLGIDRARLYTRVEPLDPDEARRFGRALCLRCAGTPVQHLTGEQAFRRLDLEVRSGVFVPRPETEVVVEHALAAIRDLVSPVVVDVGTGTGAVALAIADEAPGARVLATDRSADAVALTRANASRLGLAVEVLDGDLLAPLPRELEGCVDLVVSNPPYLTEEELSDLPVEVRADPRLALVGGLEVIERLVEDAVRWLAPGGALILEIAVSQGAAVRAALLARGYRGVRVQSDLAGRDRVAIATRPA
jgi:release factor glutamine methyltransferase